MQNLKADNALAFALCGLLSLQHSTNKALHKVTMNALWCLKAWRNVADTATIWFALRGVPPPPPLHIGLGQREAHA